MPLVGTVELFRSTTQHGQFYCSECQCSTTYAVLLKMQYLTVCFIPVLCVSSEPSGLIECLGCQCRFDEAEIYNRPDLPQATWTCVGCQRPWPETFIRCPICKIRPDGTPA